MYVCHVCTGNDNAQPKVGRSGSTTLPGVPVWGKEFSAPQPESIRAAIAEHVIVFAARALCPLVSPMHMPPGD